MAKTSSKYLSHILSLQGGGGGGISRSSMKIFATIDESGESFAAPYTCSKKIHQTESKWTLGTVPQGVKFQSGDVCPLSVLSCCRRLEMAWRASSTGTLMNKLTTSKLHDHDVRLCRGCLVNLLHKSLQSSLYM